MYGYDPEKRDYTNYLERFDKKVLKEFSKEVLIEMLMNIQEEYIDLKEKYNELEEEHDNAITWMRDL